jgi:hypothetical protein
MHEKRVEKVKSFNASEHIAGIENTSLGKLAKEILDEVNVEDIQSSLGDGDIMKALANPDGGLMKLLGTVSQKMMSKMTSGELKQETLLTEAMQFATQLGGAVPPELKNLGNLASMFNKGSGMDALNNIFNAKKSDDSDSDEEGGFNMDMITSLMKNMMAGGGPAPSAGSRGKTKVNANAMNSQIRRTVMANQMKRKLEKKKAEAKENVPGHVEIQEENE